MNPVEFNRLTIEDLEAIADRFSAAVRTIKEAQALLGGGSIEPAALPARFANPNLNRGNGISFTPAEMAEKERLRNQFIPPPEGI